MCKTEEKSISKVILWQIGSKFLLQGIAIITTPIFTRLLSTADYGKLTNYEAWLSIFGIIAGLQTYGTIANAKIKYQKSEFYSYTSSIFSISLIAYAVIIFMSIIFKNGIGILLKIESKMVPIMFIHSFFSFTTTFYAQKLLQEKKIEYSTAICLIISIPTAIISILWAKALPESRYLGRIYGMLIPLLVVGLGEIILIYQKGKTFFKNSYWKYCLSFTIPLIFHGLSGMVLTLSDRIMLTQMKGDAEVGIYGVAYNMGAIIDIIWNSFNSSWIIYYFEYKKNNDLMEIKKKSKNYMVVFTIITTGFVLCAPEVFKIMAPEAYWSGAKIIPIISCAYYFNFLYGFLGAFEFYYEKTKQIAVGTTLSAAINLILNYFMIPSFGVFGAAFATLVSYGFLFIFHYIAANYVIEEECEYKIGFFLYYALPVVIVCISYYFLSELWYIRWFLAGGMGIVLLHRIIKNKAII